MLRVCHNSFKNVSSTSLNNAVTGDKSLSAKPNLFRQLILWRCSYGSLLYMASQISAAMRHMEFVGLVHGDLAARNCLVGDRLTVKVSDLGIARSLHPDDYCRLHPGGPSLPLRWMAWESVVLVSFSFHLSSCKCVMRILTYFSVYVSFLMIRRSLFFSSFISVLFCVSS